MHTIPSRDISVVIQGPLHRDSIEFGIDTTIRSIKKSLPDAEIIISTWNGENTNDFDDFKLITSDPPINLVDKTGYPNFIGHQQRSTLAGLELCTRPYVLKIRADHSLISDSFCIEPDRVSSDNKFAIFNRKVVVSSFFLRNSLKVPFLFHISDLIQFGKKEDLIIFWNFSAPTLDEILQKNSNGHFGLFGNYCGTTLFKEVPEQTIVIRLLKRINIIIDLSYPCATNYEWFYIWEQVLAANFIVIDADKPIILFPKRFNKAFLGIKTVLSEADFILLKKTPGSRLRYARLLLNKYFLVWLEPRYWLATANIFLSYVFPTLAKNIRVWLRNKLGLVHGDRT